MAGRRRKPLLRPPVTDAAPKSSVPPPGRYRDTVLTCETCGRTFVFTVEEQRQLADAGLPVEPPTQCARCAPRAQLTPAPAPVAAQPVAETRPAAPPREAVAPPRVAESPRPAPRARRPEAEPDPFAGMYTVRSLGHVKWYDTKKGYGFVSDDDSGEEYFVHQSALEGGLTELEEGQLVEFELERKTKGYEAAHVLPA